MTCFLVQDKVNKKRDLIMDDDKDVLNKCSLYKNNDNMGLLSYVLCNIYTFSESVVNGMCFLI